MVRHTLSRNVYQLKNQYPIIPVKFDRHTAVAQPRSSRAIQFRAKITRPLMMLMFVPGFVMEMVGGSVS